MPLRILCTLLSVVLFDAALAGADEPQQPSFEQHIQPFLKTYCVGCHNGGDDSKAGLNLESFKTLMEGGDSGPVLIAGKSGDSRLVKLLLGMAKPKMPPKDSKQPTAAEIDLVKRWVDLGARGPASSAVQTPQKVVVLHIDPKVPVSAGVTAVAFSPDGKWIAAARNREVVLLEPGTGNMVHTLAGAEHPINTVAFSPDSRVIAAGEGTPGLQGAVRLWEVGGKAPRALTGHADSIYGVAFSPDNKLLATCSYDKLLLLWDLSSGSVRHTLKHHTAAVFAVTFSPDGKALASVAADQTVKLWNVETGQRILTLTEPTKALNAVAFHPKGHEFVAAGIDKMLRIWDWNGTVARLKKSAFAHDAPILAVAYAPDGRTLFTGSEDRRIKAWDAAALQERHVYPPLADWPLALSVSPDGTRLAAGLYNGDLDLFETASPKLVKEVWKGVRREVAGGNPGADPKPDANRVATPVALAASAPGEQPSAAGQTAAEPKPNPPAPRLDAVSPRTAVRGNLVKFTLTGQNIWDADRVFVQSGHLEVKLLPGDAKAPNQATCEILLPADMPAASVQVRLHTPLGSTGSKPFYVGPFAETPEKEDNNSATTAAGVPLPGTWNGTIDKKGDRDLWSFEAQAGQELVFQLAATNLGSLLTAKLTLLDNSGKTLSTTTRASNRSDAALGYRFETAGKYLLQVEDRNFTGGGSHFYSIHAGPFALVTSVFPLGIRASGSPGAAQPVAGEASFVEARGFNLGSGVKIPAPAQPGTQSIALDVPAGTSATGKTLNVARFESSSFPELVEVEPNDTPQQAQLLPVPGAISGRIGAAAPDAKTAPDPVVPATRHPPRATHSDHVAFDAKQGQRLTVEVFARRIGSPLDPVLEILTADGQPVVRHTLRAVAETYTVLRDHDSRSKGIRLNNWEDFQVNDLLLLGGELVKIQILPLGPDEDVKFFDKGGVRLGMLGTTPEAHAINSPAYKVELHPPGQAFPPNGMPVLPLYYRNDDGGPDTQGDSRLLFDAPADGRYIVRLHDVRNLSGEDFVYRLVVRPRNEDFRISLDPENPNVPRGGILPVTVTADRLDGFSGPIDVRIEGLPEGITATASQIDPNGFTCVLTLAASETAPQPISEATVRRMGTLARLPLAQPETAASPTGETVVRGTGLQTRLPLAQVAKVAPAAAVTGLQWKVLGSARIGDNLIEHATTPAFGAHQVSITSPPDLVVRVEPAVAAIEPGQELRFTATVDRRNGFKGRVPIDVQNLPHGLRVLDVGLNGVLVTEETISRSFVVHCDPWAIPGPVTFYASGRVESKSNERHASPPIRLEVKQPSVAAKE